MYDLCGSVSKILALRSKVFCIISHLSKRCICQNSLGEVDLIMGQENLEALYTYSFRAQASTRNLQIAKTLLPYRAEERAFSAASTHILIYV